MADLSAFDDGSFDLIVHPCSNVFVPTILPVWREAHRVLRPGGALLAGFSNPVVYIFDQFLAEEGIFQLKHSLPYSDLRSLTDEERDRYIAQGDPMEFGHTLEDQIGGQLSAGFHLVAMFEEEGFRAVGVAEAAPGLVCGEGALGKFTPDDDARADMERGFAIVAAMGALDVGQAAVVCEGLALAVEAAEGTDRMIERVGTRASSLACVGRGCVGQIAGTSVRRAAARHVADGVGRRRGERGDAGHRHGEDLLIRRPGAARRPWPRAR